MNLLKWLKNHFTLSQGEPKYLSRAEMYEMEQHAACPLDFDPNTAEWFCTYCPHRMPYNYTKDQWNCMRALVKGKNDVDSK